MNNLDPSGVYFDIRYFNDDVTCMVDSQDARSFYVDEYTGSVHIQATADHNSAGLTLDKESAERLNERLTEILE